MPVPVPIDALHPSRPVYLVMDAVSIPAVTTVYSEAVDCGGAGAATVWVSPAAAGSVNVQLSLDEVTWFWFAQQLNTPGPAAHTMVANVPTVRHVELPGARYVRIAASNTSGAAALCSAWVALGGGS